MEKDENKKSNLVHENIIQKEVHDETHLLDSDKKFKKSSELTKEEILNFPKCILDLEVIKRKNSDVYRYTYVVMIGNYFRLNDGVNRDYLSFNDFNKLTLTIVNKVNMTSSIRNIKRPFRLVKGFSSKTNNIYYAVQVWFTSQFSKMFFIKESDVSYLQSLAAAKMLEFDLNFEEISSEELSLEHSTDF